MTKVKRPVALHRNQGQVAMQGNLALTMNSECLSRAINPIKKTVPPKGDGKKMRPPQRALASRCRVRMQPEELVIGLSH